VRRFGAFARRGDLVLDAGCGPANDLRLLRDAGVHPVGVDLSLGALREARMLLPRHPLVRRRCTTCRSGSARSGGCGCRVRSPTCRAPPGGHLRRPAALPRRGPVYLSCYRGTQDLDPVDDPCSARCSSPEAVEAEVESLLASHGLRGPHRRGATGSDPRPSRPWVVALGRLAG
jgi:hypothetical protein